MFIFSIAALAQHLMSPRVPKPMPVDNLLEWYGWCNSLGYTIKYADDVKCLIADLEGEPTGAFHLGEYEKARRAPGWIV